MIIKLRPPLVSTTDSVPAWLAYDRTGQFSTLMATKDIPDAVQRAMGVDTKGYFEATVTDTGALSIGKRIDDQPW